MRYDFDTVYDRRGTNSVKYMAHPRYPDKRLIPMWVADMDFRTAPEIINSLCETAKSGIFGYTDIDEEYFDLLIEWNKKRFGFNIKREWITPCEGVMSGISAALRSLTKENDAVLILQPVYFPFANVIVNNKRKLTVSELKNINGRYFIDYNDLEKKITENDVKLMLFCSPHNPVGRVWDREEIIEVARICLKYNVKMISDEIHSDLVYKRHFPTAFLSDEIQENTIALTSVTKTFNLAGIQGANLIIPNEELRNTVEQELRTECLGGMGIMSFNSFKSAYKYGEAWLDEAILYLRKNIDFVLESFKGTKIKPVNPEGTYLVWLDCRELGFDDKQLEKFFLEECGIWMNNGFIFGEGGSGFMRMNVACPKATLEKAISNIKEKI